MELVVSTNIYFERRYESAILLKECLQLCYDAGYRKLDFGFAELALVSQRFGTDQWLEELREYQAFAGQKGMEFVQAHATILDFCNLTEADAHQVQLFQRSIEGAAFLGVPWVVVHPSTGIRNGKPDPDTHKRNVAFFQEYSEYAYAQGVGLAVENMWGRTRGGFPHYALNPEELYRLIEDIDCANVKICWDVEHGGVEKLDQSKWIRTLGSHIVATHISDETGPNNIHILPYFGNIDWEMILAALADIDYKGNFDFEIQHYLPGVPKELVPAAMKFSCQVGTHLVNRFEQIKRERGEIQTTSR